MRRLRVAAAIAGLAVIWLGYWVAIEHANQQERRAAAVTVPAQVLAETGPTPTVEFRVRKKSTEQVPGAPTVRLPKFSSARALAVTPHAAAHVPDDVQTLAAAKTDAAPLSDSDVPAHVPFLQSALSETHDGVPGASGRRGAMSGASLPPMWGFSSGATGTASSPVVTDDAPASIDGRPSVLGHKFAADSGDATAGTGSNGTGGSNDQNGGTQGGGTQSAGSGSNGGTGSGGSSAAGGGSTQGGGSGQGTGGATGGGNSGSNGGGGSEGGANNSLVASASATNEGTSDVVVDVPEPGSILLGLGLAAAFVRRRAR